MAATHPTRLDGQGWDLVRSHISDMSLDTSRHSIFEKPAAGKRCLLDHPIVADIARILLRELSREALIPETSAAIQAIAFDKTIETNWKVAWHQDLMFPLARRITTGGYDLQGKGSGKGKGSEGKGSVNKS